MNTLEKLSTLYLSDLDNRADYRAFIEDRDEELLKRVVAAWAYAQGYEENSANLLALYILTLALENHPA